MMRELDILPTTSPKTSSTRRSFLKTAGAVGAALAGGLTAPVALSGNEPDEGCKVFKCGKKQCMPD